MIPISRQRMLEKLAAAFPDPAIAEQALHSLDCYGQHSSEPAVDAVQLAIIKLSDGRLWRLKELVRAARNDFRNVLYPAQSDLKKWQEWLSS